MPSLAPRLLLAASVASSMATATKSSREELSSVFGWISLSSWIIPSSSQLIENYQNKSGEGLSLAFVIIWLLGDLLNLVGAIRQELLFTMTLLAAYYSVCDVILIYQYFYYKKYYVNGIRISSQSQGASETTPLLNGQPAGAEENPNASSISHARSHREEPQDFKRECLKYSFAVLLVSFTGVAAWLISRWRNGDEIPGDQPLPPARPGFRWDAQAAGWASAVLYLASRIPQIFKNRVTKCEGLSLALFVFAVVGNVTYVASILIKSTEHDYVIENLSWLVGSGGTVLLDFVVLFQFISYRM